MSTKEKIFSILKEDERLWSNGELNQILLFDLVQKLDSKIIELLFADEVTKEKFFKPIKDVFVFDERSFRFFLEENRVNNSYTMYKNRIGLTDGKHFLDDSKDVVLDFPYKDCVLEGGQSDEEGMDVYFEYDEKVTATEEKKGLKAETYNQKQAKRKEVFFNQTLAQDEIDRLFDKKALVNWKRFTKNGEEKVKTLMRDENGTIIENLIVKGNNLLVLHSLKSEFAGEVKLIYIDPPYNTGNDGFKYNDKFNHSTWLTFMKNRLEVARDLLGDDGVIFVQCDDNEQAYLKVLMDEVFYNENFICNFIWQKKTGASDAKNIATITEYTLCYARKYQPNLFSKNKESYDFNRYKLSDEYLKERGKYYIDNLDRGGLSYSDSLNYGIKCPDGTITYPNGRKEYVNDGWIWKWGKEKINWAIKNKFIEFRKSDKKESGWSVCYKNYLLVDNENNPIERAAPHKNLILDVLNNDAANEIKALFDKKAFSYPKPEKLIQKFIEISTKPNDIVLDFHLGSGTTCAVAHKMGRQYIGIEQMDYIEDIVCKRLQKVIDGEQGGISKSVNWQGGGEYVYLELAGWNKKAKEKILLCKDFDELKTFFSELYEKYFLNYNIKQKDFIEKTINEPEFQSLSLDEQKKIFIAMLDNNQMYINFSEIRDEKYGVGSEDVKMSEEFYKN